MNDAASNFTATETTTTRPRLRICVNQSGFSSLLGPCYEIALPSGKRRALALDQRHLGSEGVVQAGALSSFAEFSLQGAISDELGEDLRLVCVTLTLQFLAAARAGIWLYGEGLVLRRTRDLIFASGEVFTSERSIATASGVWKVLTHA